MKTFRVVALMTVLALISADTFAWGWGGWFKQWRHRRHQKTIKHQDNTCNPNDPGAVGAPLDGGLLVLLGSAGVAYYGVRRKKKVTEE